MERKFDILIVDDDRNLTSNLQDILSREGYSTAVAHDGQTSLNLCREKVFDLVLVDIKLPDIPGVRLVEKLTQLSPGTEYIIITGYASLGTAVEALRQKRIVAYETKPLNMDALLPYIKEVVARRRAEEEFKRSKEFSETILNSMNDAISVIDVYDYRIARVNRNFLKQLGLKEEQVIGKTCYQVTHQRSSPCQPPDDICPLLESVASGGHAVAEHVHHRADGKKVYVEVATSPLRDEKGKVVQVIHISRDITERKRAEAERHELEQQSQLTSRLASVGEMASGIAHEINNPLSSVIGFSQLLIQKDIPDDIKKDVNIISDSAQRVAGIVKRLLTFARQHKPEREYVDVNEVIETTLELRAYELKTGNIKVTTQLAPDLPRTMADGGQLQQVFLNIVINSEAEMRLAHGRGNLLIKTEMIANAIRISFKDDGPGIAEENLGKIFNPFFTTRDAGQGTGLGLSVCHGIIAEHDGFIYCESELGKGATFTVELPVVAEPEQPEVAESATGEVQAVTGARILVVDDEMSIQQFLRRVLTDEGHEVETVGNADEALDRLKTGEYDLILLDIKMPGMGGFELYRRVQKVAPSLARKVVFITGDVLGIDTRDFLSKTKAPYIAKPFDVEQLKKDTNRLLVEPVKK